MTSTLTPAAPPAAPGARDSGQTFFGRLRGAQRRFPLLQVALLIVLFVYGAVTLDGFAGWNSVRSMLVLAALVGLAAVGQTLVVIIGGFDLSVSGFIVAGALTVTQLAAFYQMDFATAFVIMIAGSLILGAIVGYICHRFKIQPIIVTLAMGAIAIGIVQVQTGGGVSGSAPEWLTAMTSPITATFGIPVPPVVVIWFVVAILLGVFLKRTIAGRKIYVTGANPKAAEFSLVRTRWVWIGVFAFSAMTASIAGLFLAGFAGNVNGTLGDPYLFQSLAAVIVGGTVFGGPGDYWRTVIGTLLLTVLSTLLIANGFTQADRQMLYGVVILLAMALYGRERRLSDRI